MSFFDQVKIVEAALPSDVVFLAGDFAEFERARAERRPVNWDAFCVVRSGKPNPTRIIGTKADS